RRGFSREGLVAIRNAYKLLYRSGKTLDEAKLEIAELAEKHPDKIIHPHNSFAVALIGEFDNGWRRWRSNRAGASVRDASQDAA
ncbi:hypothetical protein MJI47_29740, partial [Salmonella enterica subsp. enterica serovar Kentucky]|nr:hypothetical protein [Salmonella enterica subsp. enterica serovar Kentucky]